MDDMMSRSPLETGRPSSNSSNTDLDFLVGTSEEVLVGGLTFHQLGTIIAAGSTLVACLLSFFLIFMHAINYTKPYEQRQYVLPILCQGGF
jgi:hypothetical protein